MLRKEKDAKTEKHRFRNQFRKVGKREKDLPVSARPIQLQANFKRQISWVLKQNDKLCQQTARERILF